MWTVSMVYPGNTSPRGAVGLKMRSGLPRASYMLGAHQALSWYLCVPTWTQASVREDRSLRGSGNRHVCSHHLWRLEGWDQVSGVVSPEVFLLGLWMAALCDLTRCLLCAPASLVSLSMSKFLFLMRSPDCIRASLPRTSFNLHYLRADPISKFRHSEDQGFNMNLGGTQFST